MEMPNIDEMSVADLVTELKTAWLRHMAKLLREGTIASTDLATLARVLMANGWTLDPSRLPKGLADKLGDRIDPSKFDDDDADAPHGLRIA